MIKSSQKISRKITRISYNPDPDFTKPILEIAPEKKERMFSRLLFLYGKEQADRIMPELERILKVHHAHKPVELIAAEKDFVAKERFTEKDMVLITYGDMIKGEGSTPLATLHNFVNSYNLGAINTLHILPFFPYSSDRGFSVVKFKTVDRRLGNWADILNMAANYDLMFDGVLNHCSAKSRMFKEFLRGNPLFKNFFISYKSPDELTPEQRSKIFRPRTSDILTKFDTIEGPRYVWTTFSADQIDINFKDPYALRELIEGLLFYIRRGADIIRLDAVTYIWAEPGTECVQLPETHEIVKLLRDVMDTVAPNVALITETNVPHEDNISYFGNGRDEAHMVYNFALPPLVLHTFYREDVSAISQWADDLKVASDTATFFNMLDTHDGIGLMGVKGILAQSDIDFITQRAKSHGALISYKMTDGMSEEPYEINSTWWSAINDDTCDEEILIKIKRYVASRSLALVLQGIPAVYAHGTIGTPNDHELVERSKQNRDINRGVIDSTSLALAFKDPSSKLSLLRHYAGKLYITRTQNRAFHPHGAQQVLLISPDVFTVLRSSPEKDQHILTMTNVTNRICHLEIPLNNLKIEEKNWFDLLSEERWPAAGDKLLVELQPYDVIWLTPAK
ncbi:MAG: alpha-glucosidase C-terminal domain-containing protein [Deltaproteobacteria bacterium]|nr:alpha-glucosidase C-terminal domain-containing protein [Candidatus Tharpella aukensis]